MALQERTPQASKSPTKASIDPEAIARRRQLQKRLTLVSLCVGVAVSVLIWRTPGRTQSSLDRSGNQRQFGFGPMPRPGFDRRMGGRMRFFRGGPGGDRRPEWPPLSARSRYVANLATETDEYTISVGQVMCDGKNLYPGSALPDRLMGRQDRLPPQDKMLISMQILAHSPSALARNPEFAPTITVVEESGERLKSIDLLPDVTFENGVARSYIFLAPSGKEHALRSVEGEILVGSLSATKIPTASNPSAAGSGSQRAHLAFRIGNVPLPRAPLIYGEADAILIDPDTAQHLSHATNTETIATIHCLRSKSALSLDAQMPPRVPPLAPLRVLNTLILQQNLSSTFLVPRSVYAPNKKQQSDKKPKTRRLSEVQSAEKRSITAEPLHVTLIAGIDQNGEIPLRMNVADRQGKQQSVQLQVSAWDNETMLLLIPPFETTGALESHKRIAGGRSKIRSGRPNGEQMWTALRLHLEFDGSDEMRLMAGSHVNPFMAAAGQRGGELSGSIVITDEPLRSGSIKLKVTPLGANAKPAGLVTLMLDAKGAWSLPNIAPGRYLIALDTALPRSNPLAPSGTWESYMLRRFGIIRPRWQTPPQSELEIAPGGHFTVKPWRVVDTPAGIQGL